MVRFALTIVRHGETRYNKDKILQGQGVDEPLSATGFRQADAAGIFLSNVKFTHVFSSDLLRAKQTASTIIGKNKFCKDIVIQYDARLRERKYGIAEGRPLSDLKAMAKAAGEQCPLFTPSGGETLDEVCVPCALLPEIFPSVVSIRPALVPSGATHSCTSIRRAAGNAPFQAWSTLEEKGNRSKSTPTGLNTARRSCGDAATAECWLVPSILTLSCPLLPPSTSDYSGSSSMDKKMIRAG
ncbi:fructose-2,6-bisphosphatase TIGAR isoform X2 [Mauremys mutica]|uniref:fructose-2,6-bisphosphatase TIGAR isoform X2 n=1 Tax=Mauremys mutica TaxID=74926 RepID=UPI001D1579C0|nr:fructose-2,6-bisphosphatase TIGAR isoform X2 [Mauremys mutica]XP_044852910.1 fructose-2,6-bisphosphatase TIGAR isoform X2 [Mauremys mutica]